MTTGLSKQFWDDSDKLIKGCTDDELIVLKSRVERAIGKRCEKWNKKIEPKSKKAIRRK